MERSFKMRQMKVNLVHLQLQTKNFMQVRALLQLDD